MTDHLPECNEREVIGLDCICDRLRACEQRSYALGIEVGKHDGWVAGHAAGVQAARDAVAALPHDIYCVTRDENYQRPCNCPVDDALAAIDALRDVGVSE